MSELTLSEQIAVSAELQRIAKQIDKELQAVSGGKVVGFSLYVWAGGRAQYVSNCEREEIKAAMQDVLSRWSQDYGPLHKAHQEKLMASLSYQKQKYRHDPSNGVWGDCGRTVIACLLGVDRDEVPHFFENGRTGYEQFDEWLRERNLARINVIYPSDVSLDEVLSAVSHLNPGLRFSLIGKSRSGCNHVVICKDGKIEHDPSPSNAGIVGPCDDGFYWIEFLTPSHLYENGKPAHVQPDQGSQSGFAGSAGCAGQGSANRRQLAGQCLFRQEPGATGPQGRQLCHLAQSQRSRRFQRLCR